MSTALAMTVSGSSTNTSTRAVIAPRVFGSSKRPFTGSCRKNGAPSSSSPATEPRLHSTCAPSALLYHSTAADVSGTASMSEIAVLPVVRVIIVSSPAGFFSELYRSRAARGWRNASVSSRRGSLPAQVRRDLVVPLPLFTALRQRPRVLRPSQRSRVLRLVLRGQVCSCLDEHLDGIQRSGPDRMMQRRCVGVEAGAESIHVDAECEQPRQRPLLPVQRCQRQRDLPFFASRCAFESRDLVP